MLQNLENVESIPFDAQKYIFFEQAEFDHPVKEGKCYITILFKDNGWRRRTSRCKEYTASRNPKDSRPYTSIDANQEIGPVFGSRRNQELKSSWFECLHDFAP